MIKRLLRSRIAWLTLVSMGLGLIAWWTVLKVRHSLDDFNPEDQTVAELIDRLVDVSDEGIGTHSTAWVSGFIATDEESLFRGGFLGSKPPVVKPVMRELVRRGVTALPELLDHVTDQRSTQLKVGKSKGVFFSARCHSDEYHFRFDDPKKQPGGVNTGLEVRRRAHYSCRRPLLRPGRPDRQPASQCCSISTKHVLGRELPRRNPGVGQRFAKGLGRIDRGRASGVAHPRCPSRHALRSPSSSDTSLLLLSDAR